LCAPFSSCAAGGRDEYASNRRGARGLRWTPVESYLARRGLTLPDEASGQTCDCCILDEGPALPPVFPGRRAWTTHVVVFSQENIESLAVKN
jgi:hypothetical protein